MKHIMEDKIFIINAANKMENNTTEREMFELSFRRPSNYFELFGEQRWKIDEKLGTLDWTGEDLSEKDMKRFRNHYKD